MTETVEVYEESDTREALNLIQQVQTLKIVDDITFKNAGEYLPALKKLIEKRIAYFQPMISKAKESLQEIKNNMKAVVEPLEDADVHIRKERSRWMMEQETIRKKQQAEAEGKAKAAADKEQQKLLEKAVKAKTPEKQEALLDKAENVYPNPVFVEPYIDKTVELDGGGKSTWISDIEVEVDDPFLFCCAIANGKIPITINIKGEEVDIVAFKHLKAVVKKYNIKAGEIPGLTIKETQREQIRT